ncbi:MAG: periplasmic immunogenic protein [Parcubacteria group bacterium Gr01-1014_66]|nr:MAG: periplasmic immunogenic protein [Parcubacteria group bacterium Gr01-1014_66]
MYPCKMCSAGVELGHEGNKIILNIMELYNDFSPRARAYMRGLMFLLLIGLVLSSAAFTLSYFATAAKTWHDTTGARQISIAGGGKVSVKPDTAIFSASVVTQEKRVGDAQSKNSERSNEILKFLKANGIVEKDIKTIRYSISPQYTYFQSPLCVGEICPPHRPPQIVSYEVRHTLEVKVRDLKKADDLLEGVVTSGANEVGQIRFLVDDEESVKQEARKKAIEDARQKAKMMARDLGVRLGRVISFSESGGGYPPPYAMFASEARDMGGAVKSAPEVAPGEQEIQSTMTITFEIR